MRKKKTKIKIKKSKINLYNKRKSKTRQTVSLIITIAAACILGVVGFGIGRPIVNYFNEKGSQSDTVSTGDSTPSGIESTTGSSAVQSSTTMSTSDVGTSEPEPTERKLEMFVLPLNATASTESLNSALAVAKESGYTTVLVTLKDDVGVLRYKSEISRIKGVPVINAGTLSAQQICDIIKKGGMTPVARISTLKDHIAPGLFGSFRFASGTMWLDNSPEAGGKPWLSPFDEVSADYIAELTGELSAAGFKDIVCTNVKFPGFHAVDINTWLNHLDLNNMEKRHIALWNVFDKAKAAAAKNGAKLWVEMSGANLINPQKSCLDSELANNPERLKTIPIIADYTMSTEVSGVYADAKAFAEKVKTASNGAELVVMVKGLKGAALADAEKAFEEAGLSVSLEN